MPLHVPPAPAPALRSVLAALGSPTAVRDARTPALQSVQGPLSPELPLPVHVLSVLSPVTPASLTGTAEARTPQTRLVGWRFLIHSGDRAVAAADTMLTADGWAFSRFFEGPYITATERALRQAETLGTDFQPRLLSVPELYMLTLWLHGDTEADASTGAPEPADILVPLAPAPPGFAAHRPHRVAELLPRIGLRLAPAPLLSTTA
ncbi:hypothetical protein KQY30_30700 [Streptomyces sp. GMY02]|uniref:hypothetical protein n=1 Tax=Streptomyces sp. GMY02 TaxID=1333528 RepID=UPI001C2CAF20|nr:hypothetical protein [Streptomyces sp. GMY02]QXE37949.1 hypothetical protein KQY30_30700 [Streptomyces sp. GMY02]